jgi:hypothetical protein
VETFSQILDGRNVGHCGIIGGSLRLGHLRHPCSTTILSLWWNGKSLLNFSHSHFIGKEDTFYKNITCHKSREIEKKKFILLELEFGLTIQILELELELIIRSL